MSHPSRYLRSIQAHTPTHHEIPSSTHLHTTLACSHNSLPPLTLTLTRNPLTPHPRPRPTPCPTHSPSLHSYPPQHPLHPPPPPRPLQHHSPKNPTLPYPTPSTHIYTPTAPSIPAEYDPHNTRIRCLITSNKPPSPHLLPRLKSHKHPTNYTPSELPYK